MKIYEYQDNVSSKSFWDSEIVKSKSNTVFLTIQGPGIINKLWLSTFPSTILQDNELANNLIINIYWDNSEKPSVSVPIADFFCQALKLQAIENHFFNSTNNQMVFNAEIPMPFKQNSRLELVNYSDQDIEFFYGVDVELKKLKDNTMYLHSYWQCFNDWPHQKSLTVLPEIKGKGRYLGTHISLHQKNVLNNWPWYTRPISIALDISNKNDKPSLHINTIDDFFGSGWWDREKKHNTYTYRCNGRSLVELNDNNDLSIVMYRYHIPDPLWFHKSILIHIGKNWNWQHQNIANGTWSTTTFFYLNSQTNELPEINRIN